MKPVTYCSIAFFWLMTGLALVSCNDGNKKNPSATPPLAETSSSTVNIRSETDQIVEEAPQVKPHTENIVKETKDIDRSTAEVTKIIAQKDGIIADQAKTIEDDKNSTKKHLKTITYLTSGIAFAACVACIIALVLGYLKTLVPLIGAGGIFVAAITFGFLIDWFWLIALVTIVISVGSLGYIIWHHRSQLKEAKAQVPNA